MSETKAPRARHSHLSRFREGAPVAAVPGRAVTLPGLAPASLWGLAGSPGSARCPDTRMWMGPGTRRRICSRLRPLQVAPVSFGGQSARSALDQALSGATHEAGAVPSRRCPLLHPGPLLSGAAPTCSPAAAWGSHREGGRRGLFCESQSRPALTTSRPGQGVHTAGAQPSCWEGPGSSRGALSLAWGGWGPSRGGVGVPSF